MKKILWLTSWYPDDMNPYNGDFIQRHAHAVSASQPITVIYMAQHGPEIDIPATETRINTNGNLTEIIVYYRYKKTGMPLMDKLRYNWEYFRHFRRVLQQFISESGTPSLVHVHIPMKAGRLALWLQDKYQVPYIISEHSSAYSGEVPDSYDKRASYYRKWVKLIFERAAAVTTVSKKLGDRLKELFAIKSMHIIPNVVETHYFNYAPQPPARFRFLHASTMDHPKNVEGILRTLNQLKQVRQDWECVMLGWDTPALKKLANDLLLNEHLTWKGIVPYQQVAVEMQHASALLMFSRYENLPCVILESLCCGLPVIATSVGGIPEVVNTSNGILVEAGDEKALLQALQQCMNNPEQFDRAAMAAHARNLFSYDAMGKQFVALYTECLKG